MLEQHKMSDDTFEAFMSRKMSSSSRKGGVCIICCLLSFALLPIYNATDTITLNQSITDGKTLVSSGKVFELGFFRPDKKSPTKAAYLGIWYHGIKPQTVVWVANRDRPVTDYPGVFAMTDDGDLQVIDGKRSVLWSALKLIPEDYVRPTAAVLQNDGNLVLKNDTGIVWKSFSYPSDTLLPGMNMEKKFLQSWKNNSNPALGEFTFSLSSTGRNQFMVLNHTAVYWMSGWSDDSFSVNGLRDCLASMMFPDYVNACSVVMADAKVRLVMNSSGRIEFFQWGRQSNSWILYWTEPKDACSFYNTCGDYGVCSSGNNSKLKCECLPGFMPNSAPQWKSGNYSSGCKREIADCDTTEYDNFENISLGKVGYPDDSFSASIAEECMEDCKSKCCDAYLFVADGNSYTCREWSKDSDSLKNLRSGLNTSLEVKLWIRVVPDRTCSSLEDCKQWPSSTCQLDADGREKCICVPGFHWDSAAGDCTPDGSTKHTKPLSWILPLSIAAGMAFTALAAIGLGCSWRKLTVGRKGRNEESDHDVNKLRGFNELQEDRTEIVDVPYFDFEMIVAATDNFSDSNKLGQGGFGPVYKGKFPGGQEIAVKRLAKSSGQGLEEFKNEVILIAKLQHRNLVRLLGYCTIGEEKMLIYEYMPNKSLDFILFDTEKCVLLNWETRYNILLGVARGLVYLHQDSRLRIIHRDLKTSNILLDEEMNPKISDFGMARIFGGKQIEANTNRVVGTYGYMSPEYAMDGLFSIKSDVFSFGIVALEIISGQRNMIFYHTEQALTLSGYAWKLWNDNTGLDLVDPSLREDYHGGRALKCIQIALLCVQDDAADRPTMSEVVSMFSSETAVVPNPKQPIFVVKRCFENLVPSKNPEFCSSSELTITFDGR